MNVHCCRSILWLTLSALHGLAHAEHEHETPLRLPEGVAPTSYTLDLAIDPAKETFEGVVSIEVSFAHATQNFWIHAQDLVVHAAALKTAEGADVGVSIAAPSADGTAQVKLAQPVPAGPATLTVRYRGSFNPRLEGLYVASAVSGRYVGSQMEPLGARRVLPSFDEPRFKTPFIVSLTVPSDMAAITNGAAASSEPTTTGLRRHRFAATAPIPTYLLAFLVGPYEFVDGALAPNAVRKTAVPFRAAAARGKRALLSRAVTDTPALVNYLESYFGIPYRYTKLDLISVPTFPAGAMENASAIVYRESALLIPRNASRAQWRTYLSTHSHELAHQWFGNYVTPAWWDDLWLNESFATWLGNKAAHAIDPNAAFDRATIVGALRAMETDSLAHTRRIREPITRSDAVESAFDAITYQKGAAVLSMHERFVGEERFRAGVRTYMSRHPDGVATAEQFFDALGDGAQNTDLVMALRSFVDQPHVPVLDVDWSCEHELDPQVRVRQAPYRAIGSSVGQDYRWVIPLSITYSARHEIRQAQRLMSGSQVDVTLSNAACPDWILPNAGGAGYWRFNLKESHWRALLNGFFELQPGEQLVTLASLSAAFRANAVSANMYLQGLETALSADSWDVVLAAARELAEGAPAWTLLDRSHLRRRLVDMLAERGRDLVESKTLAGDEQLLRSEIARILILGARDPQLIRRLGSAVVAKGYAAFARDPDLYSATAAATVLLSNGRLRSELLEATLREVDQSKRLELLTGFASAVGTESLEPILASVESKRVAAQDLLPLLQALMDNVGTGAATWRWVQANGRALAEQLPVLRKPSLPTIAGRSCDMGIVRELDEFFSQHRHVFPGAERSLAQTVEQIRLCTALRAARESELAAAVAQPRRYTPPD